MTQPIELLTISESASALRLRPSCIRRWLRESKLTSVHVGRLVRIPQSEIARIIQEGTRPAIARLGKANSGSNAPEAKKAQ
jgi:excisionase family DNA binding protein